MKSKLIAPILSSFLLVPAAYAATDTPSENSSSTANNWEASLIVEGLYVDRGEGEMEIHGMPSGGHNHGLEKGLQLGHNELVITGDITEYLGTRLTTAITEKSEDEGSGLEIEVEEAFIETQGIGNGFSAKAGRFYTDMGYLSSKHNHEWDFADQPLIYEGMFGTHPTGDGIQLSYLAPTDTFLKFGVELFADEEFPSGKTNSTISAATAYMKLGGDIGTDHSWLVGLGHWRANDISREGAAHHDEEGHEEHESHDDDDHEEEVHHAGGETALFSGDSAINSISAVYKWAPNGNAKERNFKFQIEYFQRDEDGTVSMLEEDGEVAESISYEGEQSGWYAKAVYQFRPHWRIGVRHDAKTKKFWKKPGYIQTDTHLSATALCWTIAPANTAACACSLIVMNAERSRMIR